MDKVLYIIGSLRNPRIPELAKQLRKDYPNVESFDDWFAAGAEADDYWKSYEQSRGRTYEEALAGYAAKHVFSFDKFHLDRATHVLLVLPAGKSGHMEVMYAAYGAKNKPKTAILLDPEDVRWDVMYQFVPTILNNDSEIGAWLGEKDGLLGRGYHKGGSAVSRERDDGGAYPGWYDDLNLQGYVHSRRPIGEELVSDGGWSAGLLPECIGGGQQAVVRCDTAASSRFADALGSQQKHRSPEQDTPSSYRYGKL
jgi:hypothetical protein